MDNIVARGAALITFATGVPAISYTLYSLNKASDEQNVSLYLTVSVLIVTLLSWVFYREVVTARKYKYHRIVKNAHSAVHASRDLVSYLNERLSKERLSSDEFEAVYSHSVLQITNILDDVVAMFSEVGKGRYRACIKGLIPQEDRIQVYAVARDSESRMENAVRDKQRFIDKDDWVDANEDFTILYSEDERCFVDNNLPKRKCYSNSSVSPAGNDSRKVGWPLSYKSTFVWPIRQVSSSELSVRSTSCLGFLAVDSTKQKAFDAANDFALGALVADALYHPLRLLNALAVRQDETEEHASA